MAIQKSIIARNAELDALAPMANNGYLRIYTGNIPASPEDAPNGILLAELRFNGTAFAVASGGIIKAHPLTSDTSARATGIAGYFRALKSDGITPLWDGTVGVDNSKADLILNSTTINLGVNVAITGLTMSLFQS